MGTRLSIDETALSNGELYTIITNKAAKGKKGALVAIIKGTKEKTVAEALERIPFRERVKVEEVTLDMSIAMKWIVRSAFPNAAQIIDRFHVQQLVTEALQEMRIKLRWEAIAEENDAIAEAKRKNLTYKPPGYSNGDSKKQLLARSRYMLFKSSSKWTESQKERAGILFEEFPELEEAYKLSMQFRSFYEHSTTGAEAKTRLDDWYQKVEEKGFKSFSTAAESIKAHETNILYYFPGRSTNASAESFNAKLKGFRALVRGVTDKKFFLFRIAKLYA